jgi:hypothetical protein
MLERAAKRRKEKCLILIQDCNEAPRFCETNQRDQLRFGGSFIPYFILIL